MRKKIKQSVELLPPPESHVTLDKLAELVATKLQRQQAQLSDAELTESVLLEPWFLPREISIAIMRLLPVTHRDTHSFVYEDWGCFRCGTREKIHGSHGLCLSCHCLYTNRLKACIASHAKNDGLTPRELAAQHTKQSDSARALLGTSRKVK